MSYVLDYLQGRGAEFTVIPHPKTATAVGEEQTLHLPGDEVVKTLVVMANYGPALMVVPASRRLDMEAAAAATADPQVRLATERELERQFPVYALAALPPLSMLLLAPMYVDPTVAERETIVFAAGRQDVSIRMATSALFDTDPVVITPLTAESRAAEAAATPTAQT